MDAHRGSSSVTIYVLECEDAKYYVGKTMATLPHARVLDHFRGQGSLWTTYYPPVRVVATFPNCSDFDEDKHTKQYMAKYGIANVRGGTYCQVELAAETVRFLEREIRGARNACLRCGRTSHFVGDCFARTDVQGKFIVDAAPSTERRSTTMVPLPKRPRSSFYNGNNDRRYGWSYECSDGSSEDDGDEDDNTCFRCGRSGHWAKDCYARTNVNGKRFYY